jgi:hypothetical protein
MNEPDPHRHRLSPAAAQRGHRAITVAEILAAHADEIAAAVPHLPAKHVLVAVVAGDDSFGGTHHVAETELIERVKELEFPDGSAMVFSPGADADHVRTRAAEMAALARKRIETIERINARKSAD